MITKSVVIASTKIFEKSPREVLVLVSWLVDTHMNSQNENRGWYYITLPSSHRHRHVARRASIWLEGWGADASWKDNETESNCAADERTRIVTRTTPLKSGARHGAENDMGVSAMDTRTIRSLERRELEKHEVEQRALQRCEVR